MEDNGRKWKSKLVIFVGFTRKTNFPLACLARSALWMLCLIMFLTFLLFLYQQEIFVLVAKRQCSDAAVTESLPRTEQSFLVARTRSCRAKCASYLARPETAPTIKSNGFTTNTTAVVTGIQGSYDNSPG